MRNPNPKRKRSTHAHAATEVPTAPVKDRGFDFESWGVNLLLNAVPRDPHLKCRIESLHRTLDDQFLLRVLSLHSVVTGASSKPTPKRRGSRQ